MKDEIQNSRQDAANEQLGDGDKEHASRKFSEEVSNLLVRPDLPYERERRLIDDVNRIFGPCTVTDTAREGMTKEEIDKSVGKIADGIAKKGGFGNAFDRDALNTMLQDAQRKGSLDEVLQALNAQIKKTNPDLTVSWNTTIVKEADGGKKIDSVVNLIDAKTGKPEDQARISTQTKGHCETVVRPERDPWSRWPGIREELERGGKSQGSSGIQLF